MNASPSYIFHNSQVIQHSSTCLTADDRGFTFGDGIFETILSYNYYLPFFEQHWQRLINSANLLNINLPGNYTKDYILTIIQQLLKKNLVSPNSWQGIKIILSRGVSSTQLRSLTPLPEPYECNFIIQTFNCTAPKIKPQSLQLSPFKVSEYGPLTQIKSLNYLDKILAKQHALTHGFNDALLVNTSNNILEATTSNIFFIDKNNKIITPPIKDGLLPGITRQFVIDVCRNLKISIKEASVAAQDLSNYTAAFITNAILGLNLISQVDQQMLSRHKLIEKIQAQFTQMFLTNKN